MIPDFTLQPLLKEVRRHWRYVLTDTSPVEQDRAAAFAQALCLLGRQRTCIVKFLESPKQALQYLAGLPNAQAGDSALWLASLRRKELFDAFEAQLSEDMQAHIAEELYCNLDWLRPGAYLSGLNCNFVLNGAEPCIPQEPALLGGQDAYWLAAYDFAQRGGFLRLSPPLDAWFAAYKLYAQDCGWMFTREDVVIFCNRPILLRLDHNGRLHNPAGPAIKWSDGSGLYAWTGCLIPSWAVEEPERLGADSIAAQKDPLIRRALFEIWAGRG